MENKAGKHGSAPMLYLTLYPLSFGAHPRVSVRTSDAPDPNFRASGRNASKVDNATAGEKVTSRDEFYDRLTPQP